MATCYRHPGRETGVSCSNCGRPICPDCMTPTPVGMRCPECAKQRTKVQTAASMRAGAEPRITVGIMVLCVLLFLASGQFGVRSTGGTSLYDNLALLGIGFDGIDKIGVSAGEYWRLVSGGFLHAGLLHIGFNMYLLWLLGSQLEPLYGPARYAALYLTALLAGAFGALVQTTVTPTVGASGAVFGLMGAFAVEMYRRGHDPLRSDIGFLILFNLAFSFLPGFNVSFGGHIGGLVGGVLAAFAYDAVERFRLPRWAGVAAVLVIGAAFTAAAIAIAGNPHDRGL